MFSVYMINKLESYKLYYVDSYKTRTQAESVVYRILKTTRESCYISKSADLHGLKLADVWAREHVESACNHTESAGEKN
jgi:hypothetical protein